MWSGRERKLIIQKTVIGSLIGLIACGISIGYVNFYKEVAEYKQSVMYRETEEARKEYSPQLMKKNQRLLSRLRAESSSGMNHG